jgi:hypothetical protein
MLDNIIKSRIHRFFKTLCLLYLCCLGMTSCEDVIELDLDTTAPQLVIEANLMADVSSVVVLITRTNDFYDNSKPESVSNAVISLESNTGEVYMLTQDDPGEYKAENIQVNSGDIFTLRVALEDEFYEASTTVPFPAVLDSIEQGEFAFGPLGDDDEGNIQLTAIWDDPAGVENFYRVRSFLGDSLLADVYTILKDEFQGDGEQQRATILRGFNENDRVTVELLTTDEEYYDYFFQLSTLSGQGFGATTPYNPKGNFDNGALGYFGIYYASRISIEL